MALGHCTVTETFLPATIARIAGACRLKASALSSLMIAPEALIMKRLGIVLIFVVLELTTVLQAAKQ
jgi:hypothetical protein